MNKATLGWFRVCFQPTNVDLEHDKHELKHEVPLVLLPCRGGEAYRSQKP